MTSTRKLDDIVSNLEDMSETIHDDARAVVL